MEKLTLPRLLGKDSLITDRWNFHIPGDVSGIYAGIFKIVVGIGVRGLGNMSILALGLLCSGCGFHPTLLMDTAFLFPFWFETTQAPGGPTAPSLTTTRMVFVCELMGILPPSLQTTLQPTTAQFSKPQPNAIPTSSQSFVTAMNCTWSFFPGFLLELERQSRQPPGFTLS